MGNIVIDENKVSSKEGQPSLLNPNPTASISTDKVEKQVAKHPGYIHFGKEVRLGSRVIKIMQTPKFSLLPKGPDAKTIRSEEVVKIGSQWKRDTRDIIRGLSPEEEIFYMPRILGISPSSDNWNDKLTNYWADFGILIPSEGGVKIEVGFKEVPGRSGVVEPISLDGYMKYNFCRANSDVATEPKQLDNTFLYRFYFIDEAKEQIDSEKNFELMKNINRLYDQLIASTETSARNKIDWILETEGGPDNVGINIMGLSPLQREMELGKFKDKSPIRFKELLNDSTLETKALIRKAVEKGVLLKEGNAYFQDSKVIGSTLLEAVGYLDNPNNQQDKLIIQARIKAISI